MVKLEYVSEYPKMSGQGRGQSTRLVGGKSLKDMLKTAKEGYKIAQEIHKISTPLLKGGAKEKKPKKLKIWYNATPVPEGYREATIEEAVKKKKVFLWGRLTIPPTHSVLQPPAKTIDDLHIELIAIKGKLKRINKKTELTDKETMDLVDLENQANIIKNAINHLKNPNYINEPILDERATVTLQHSPRIYINEPISDEEDLGEEIVYKPSLENRRMTYYYPESRPISLMGVESRHDALNKIKNKVKRINASELLKKVMQKRYNQNQQNKIEPPILKKEKRQKTASATVKGFMSLANDPTTSLKALKKFSDILVNMWKGGVTDGTMNDTHYDRLIASLYNKINNGDNMKHRDVMIKYLKQYQGYSPSAIKNKLKKTK
jgi:hypothetical protein